MSTASIKAALVQELNQGDVQSNLARIEQRVAEAAQQGAQLVLLQA
jgi:N-carbamoylputrescine amidase